ncbi:hypothetical protein M6D81_17575 [Paenibacillus sp. J5C_2022]|nr:hypothetical protein [Paenibacillus sp. J5C2022]
MSAINAPEQAAKPTQANENPTVLSHLIPQNGWIFLVRPDNSAHLHITKNLNKSSKDHINNVWQTGSIMNKGRMTNHFRSVIHEAASD